MYSGGVFKSTNGGVDWKHVWPPENAAPHEFDGAPDFVADLQLDRGDPKHLLINFHTNCTDPYVGLCLAESLDGGDTWRVANGDAAMGTYQAHDSRAYLLGGKRWLFGTMDALWATDDAGASWKIISHDVFHGALYEASDHVLYLGGMAGVLRSEDQGMSWSLVPSSGQQVGGVTGDGTSVYASTMASCIDLGENLQVYESSKSGSAWNPVKAPDMPQGATQLGYEADHRILYSSNCSHGLWRVRLP
jgi:photosystem II stability/assembly factor-like uncharacterized protein